MIKKLFYLLKINFNLYAKLVRKESNFTFESGHLLGTQIILWAYLSSKLHSHYAYYFNSGHSVGYNKMVGFSTVKIKVKSVGVGKIDLTFMYWR